jgi:hypothetical protein
LQKHDQRTGGEREVRPVVAARRKLNAEKTTSKMTDATATPPISAGSPSWPMIAMSTTLTSGVER